MKKRQPKLEPQIPLREDFTQAIMLQVNKLAAPKQKRAPYQLAKEMLQMRKLHIKPLGSIVGLITVLSVTGAAAAATYWFGTTITTREQNSTIELSVHDCSSRPLSDLVATGAKAPERYSFTEKYEIIDKSSITKNEIEQAQLGLCEERAIAAEINKRYPDMQEFQASEWAPSSKGLYQPVYNRGTISSIDENEVTVQDIEAIGEVSDQGEFIKPEKMTRTITLLPDTIFLRNGQATAISSLKPGDQIYFAYQNRTEPGQIIKRGDLEGLRAMTQINEQSVIRGAGLLTVDYRIIEKFQKALADDDIRLIYTDPTNG